MIREAATLSGGRISLRAGTLYAALDRLAAERLVEVDRESVPCPGWSLSRPRCAARVR